MVKKFNRPNFKRNVKPAQKNSKQIQNNHYNSDEEYDQKQNQKLVKEISEGYIILDKLNSTIYSERESITSLLLNQEFNQYDNKIRDQIVSIELCRSLVDKLTDPYIQIRYNSISAIINLIFCYSDCEIDKIFFFNTNLITHLEFLINESNLMHLSANKGNFTQNEISKNEKLIKNIWELLLLSVDLYDETRGYDKIDYDKIIRFCVVNLINYWHIKKEKKVNQENNILFANDKEYFNLFEEIIIKSNMFLSNLSSVKCLKINENNCLKEFMEFSFNFLIEFDTNKQNLTNSNIEHHGIASFINTSLVNTLLYLYCSNSEIPMNLNLISLIGKVFENVDFSVPKKLLEVNEQIQNLVKNIDKEEKNKHDMKIEDNNTAEIIPEYKPKDKEDESEKIGIMKRNLKYLDTFIKINNLNLKTINDIITQFDGFIPSNKCDSQHIIEEMEGISADEEEINLSNTSDDKSEIEKKIYCVFNKEIFLNNNFEQLRMILNNDFINNLSNFFNNLTIEEFLFNDFDRMLIIKEGLFELEYNTISILNNLIYNFDGLFNDRIDLIKFIFSTIYKRTQIEEFTRNEDFLSVLLTAFRNILLKFPNLDINILDIDFKTFFLTFNKNSNDRFIKIIIIDIISMLFSNFSHPLNVNLEICNILYNIFFTENDMEVIAHVLNAFFDIYKDEYYNVNLITVNVINTMKAGIAEFNTRIKNSYKIQEIDKEAYNYCKESLLNMKRFIKYKEKMFKQQNI